MMRLAFRLFYIFIFFLFILVSYSSALSKVIKVPDDNYYIARTIQEGIQHAKDGDTVLVASGTYSGEGNTNIRFHGKKIILKSENGPDSTIIDCEEREGVSAFIFDYALGESIDSGTIDGFTITRSMTSAIICSSPQIWQMTDIDKSITTPLITNCYFKNNTASYIEDEPDSEYGGAILVKPHSAPVIKGCTFQENNAGKSGGAICLLGTEDISPKKEAGSAIVENCNFLVNYANLGGAIAAPKVNGRLDNQKVEIKRSVFQNNESGSVGGAIGFYGDSIIVTNSIFNKNKALSTSSSGGAVYLKNYKGFSTFKNSTFYSNESHRYGSIYCEVINNGEEIDLKSTVSNCILYSSKCKSTNKAEQETNLESLGSNNPWGSVTVENCNIEYLSSKTWITPESHSAYHNIDIDPQFVDAENGDFRLKSTSPCIDSGKNISGIYSDFRGSLRPIDGNNDNIAKFDMGAYEYSAFFSGESEDAPTKAFDDIQISSPQIVPGYNYDIEWNARSPFPQNDIRISQSGEYQVNIALVDATENATKRITLVEGANQTVSGAGSEYSYSFECLSDYVGDWYILIELTKDPTQFALSSNPITIKSQQTDVYDLGDIVSPPDEVQSDTELEDIEPDVDDEEACYWSPITNTLYAIKPDVTVVVTWYADQEKTVPIHQLITIQTPTDPQLHIANTPDVDLLPEGSSYDFVEIEYSDSTTEAQIVGDQFTANGNGFSVILYQNEQDEEERMKVIRTVPWNNSDDAPKYPIEVNEWDIGKTITDPDHNSECGSGYVFFENAFYDGYGADKAYDRLNREGPIIPVNKDLAANDEDDMVVIWYQMDDFEVSWPYISKRYHCIWPEWTENSAKSEKEKLGRIVIASQLGSGGLDASVYGTEPDMKIYNQPDRTAPGFNPNEEHAMIFNSKDDATKRAVFALRNDLNISETADSDDPPTSEPYVLLKYKDPATNEWAMKVYQVVAEDDVYSFNNYSTTVGNVIEPPYPLTEIIFSPCEETCGVPPESGPEPYFEDKNGELYSKTADLGNVVLNFYYPLQEDFYYDLDHDNAQDVEGGTCIPWKAIAKEATVGNIINATYHVQWPEDVPGLLVGDTLIEAKDGLPDITNQCSVEILYEQAGQGNSIKLMDPLAKLTSPLSEQDFPDDIKVQDRFDKRILTDLPPHLQCRFYYDTNTQQLVFEGYYDDSGAGEALLLLNVMSGREQDILLNLDLNGGPNSAYKTAVRDLFNQKHGDDPSSTITELYTAEAKALSAGNASATGYVTLVFNNHEDCGPVSLEVIKVDCPLYTGEIKSVSPDDVFDNKVTLRHTGNCAGECDDRIFEWRYWNPSDADADGSAPDTVKQYWLKNDQDKTGAVNITIEGSGNNTLSDKWFQCRYQKANVCWDQETNEAIIWSDWTSPMLYEGWIKRIVSQINLYDHKVKDFHENEVNTVASMIMQAGGAYEGDAALNSDPDNLNNLGLIEFYETILNRGKELSIDADNREDNDDIYQALLLAANRLASLYMLLGNEAFADAADPTIGFSTADGQYGSEAPSIFCFQNQMSSLLEEELALLRGKDDTGIKPYYNKLIWNFTQSDGEVAYHENYNITDQNDDGLIDEYDAKIMFPQGHGDAWGHYLSAIKTYYALLTHEYFTWTPKSESILVAGVPVEVDYEDERLFARIASAKAKAGSEIANLTFRQQYGADASGQLNGYKDTQTEPERAWGVSEWADRCGQGAYFDWVVGNAILPSEDTEHEGLQKIDRTTVAELRDIATYFTETQTIMDQADIGMTPLGIATNAVPFDIDPSRIDQNETHFEQIYQRAVTAMNNAIAVFNHANQSTTLLRRQQDTLADFQKNVVNQEADFNNRLIEVFGYPYPDDCGPGKTYPSDYDSSGPDLYHYMYVEPSELMGIETPKTHEFTVQITEMGVDDQTGALYQNPKEVKYHIDTNSKYGLIKPEEWSGRRKAPGEIQIARSDMLQTRGRFEKVLTEYENLINQIEGQAALIEAQMGVNAQEINILNETMNTQRSLNEAIKQSRYLQQLYQRIGSTAVMVSKASSEALPGVMGIIAGLAAGTIVDATSGVRSTIELIGARVNDIMNVMAEVQSYAQMDYQNQKEIVSLLSNIKLTALKNNYAIQQQLFQLENLIRSESSLRLEIYTMVETLQQSSGRYLAALAKGHRIWEDRDRFRRQTAADIQDYRYKDMTFRIFRNDALQKYRAQFDMAAMYVYLAAKAYDYETNLLDSGSQAGQVFLSNIVQQRTIGQIQDGQPLTGSGLADPMARMRQNFQVLKSQMGFNNPQQETNRFSLRKELLRITMDGTSNENWRNALDAYKVPDLWDISEYRRYCRPFRAEGIAQPGIVIPFSTNITPGMNLFGWPLGGGDSYYSPTNFATKVRSVGVWFSNYNSTGMAETPRIYLVPAGEDVLRSPSVSSSEIRTWNVVDQKLPVPFPINQTEMENDSNWIPLVSTLDDEIFQIRRHSDFKAYHDSGVINESEMKFDSRLVGRSVWNTQWLLIIPGEALLSDPAEGIKRFIYGPEIVGSNGERTLNGVSDIKLFFHTYAYSGN